MKKMFLNQIRFLRNFSTKANQTFYVTTPIFYVNAAPHIGHLYSAAIADATFRFEKLLNNHENYFLSTGTDEHGTKIKQAAAKQKIPVKLYTNQISKEYETLFKKFNINFTKFIRTTDEEHMKAVQHFWNILKSKDQIYSSSYAGWYCVSDETFLTECQLREADGQKVSLESGHPVEWTNEINYMFRLSDHQDDILYWLKQKERIKPPVFNKILLDMLEEPLHDISVSRPSNRVDWGIKVPGDNSQTIYVWLDALINYLTTIGYPNENFQKSWPPSLQIVGKDIMKFHAIYWPAFLIAAGLEPPDRVLVHSHWTVDGEKMSKSKFNVVDPNECANIYTNEGLRYFLLREGVPHNDGNYSDIKIQRCLNAELANTFGNLLSRGCAKSLNHRHVFPKLRKADFVQLLEIDATGKLVELVAQLPDKCYGHYKSYNFYMVVDQVMEVLHVANTFFETCKPWELTKAIAHTGSMKNQCTDHQHQHQHPDETNLHRLETILSITLETLRVCGIIFQPIIPELSGRLLDKLNIHENKRSWEDLSYVRWNKNGSEIDEWNLGGSSNVLFNRLRIADVQKKLKLN